MKVLILEDEPLAAELLAEELLALDPGIQVLAILSGIEEGKAWFSAHPLPDLILSDIMLQDGLSFDLFEAVRPQCPVIFITAYDQYAIRAFEVNSIDYLLKPLNREKLGQALDKFKNRATIPPTTDFSRLAHLLQREHISYKSRFLVRLGQKIRTVPVEQVAYFYTQDKLSFLVTWKGERYPLDRSLEELEQQLDPAVFFRANRKVILHINAIREIHPYFKGRLKLELQPDFPGGLVVSSERSPLFKDWLDK
jgi:two-component system, LytTR family, response regulator LytT